MTDRFSVFQFVKGGTTERVAESVDAQTAVETAHSYTTRPAAVLGIIEMVRITDADDYCVFEWRFGKGVTYPPHDGKRFVADSNGLSHD